VDRVRNLEYELHTANVQDVRGKGFSLLRHGVQVVRHESRSLDITNFQSVEDHKRETEQLLSAVFPEAERTFTWDSCTFSFRRVFGVSHLTLIATQELAKYSNLSRYE
jgi:hypothetical protein